MGGVGIVRIWPDPPSSGVAIYRGVAAPSSIVMNPAKMVKTRPKTKINPATTMTFAARLLKESAFDFVASFASPHSIRRAAVHASAIARHTR